MSKKIGEFLFVACAREGGQEQLKIMIARRLLNKFWQSQGVGGQKEKGDLRETNFCPPAPAGVGSVSAILR